MIISRKGKETKINGTPLAIGQKIPDFNVKDRNGNILTEKNFKGKKLLISIYPDINTSVCDMQTRRFFEIAAQLKDVLVLNISNNSVDDLNSWCASSGLDVEMLSAFDDTFANSFNLWMPEYKVLARSIYVVNEQGEITYVEIVPDMATEPNYELAIKAVQSL